MKKVVILNLDGDLPTLGLWATLEIRAEEDTHGLQIKGRLPPNPSLARHLQQHWQEKYRPLGIPVRIKGEQIINKGSINQRIAQCRESAQELRNYFCRWLNSDEFQPVTQRLREELNRQDIIRFLIRTSDAQLQKLPWQEWSFFERYPQAEVALGATEFELLPGAKPFAAKKHQKVRILAILGHAQGIDVEVDRAKLASLPHAEVNFLVEPERQQLNEQLWEQPWDLLFFAGHSETQGEKGRIYINRQDSLSVGDLKYGLRRAIAQGLQLAIFNSCDGLGLAYELEQLHIPQLILMREPVADQVAQVFLQHFLQAFSQGESLYLAVRQARERLQGLENRFPCASWLPVIYQNPGASPPNWLQLRGGETSQQRLIAPGTKNRLTKRLSLRRRLLTSLGITAAVLLVRWLGFLQPWELAAYDHLLRSRPPELVDDRILVVEITSQDLNNYGGYPLTDEVLAQLLATLSSHHPQAIGVDLHRYQPRGQGRAALMAQFAKYPHLFTVCAYGASDQNYATPPEFSATQRSNQVGFSNLLTDNFSLLNRENNRAPRSSVQLTPGQMVRRQILSYAPNLAEISAACNTPYSLSLLLASQFIAQESASEITVTNNQEWQLGNTIFPHLPARFGGYQHLDGLSAQIMLNYRSGQPGRRVSVQKVLTGQCNTDWIKDRIVLVGYTADVARDNLITPYGEMPGVWIHAHMISQLLSTTLDGRALIWTLPLWGDAIWLFIWSLAGGGMVLIWRLNSPIWSILSLGVSTGLLYYICLVLIAQGGWLPLVPAVIVLWGSYLQVISNK